MKDNLVEFKEQAYLSKELATIKLDCDLDLKLNEAIIQDMFNKLSYDLFTSLEFSSLLKKFNDGVVEQSLEFETIIIEDFDAYKSLICKIHKSKKFGFSLIEGSNGLVGASICLDSNSVFFVPFVNFITEEMLINDIVETIQQDNCCCMIDLKSHLKYMNLVADNNIFDCSLAAYLNNPLNSAYEYNNIAFYKSIDNNVSCELYFFKGHPNYAEFVFTYHNIVFYYK